MVMSAPKDSVPLTFTRRGDTCAALLPPDLPLAHRWALDRASLGVPVLAVGVPTVVDASTLAADLLGQEELPPLGEGRDLLVTPKDIDSQVDDLAKVIGYGISLALQPGLDVADLDLLLS